MRIFNLNLHELQTATVDGDLSLLAQMFSTDATRVELGDHFGYPLFLMAAPSHYPGSDRTMAFDAKTGTIVAYGWLSHPGEPEDIRAEGVTLALAALRGNDSGDRATLDPYLPTVEDPPTLFLGIVPANTPLDAQDAAQSALIAFHMWRLSPRYA